MLQYIKENVAYKMLHIPNLNNNLIVESLICSHGWQKIPRQIINFLEIFTFNQSETSNL